MTVEKLNRLAQLGFYKLQGTASGDECGEYQNLIREWKSEIDNKFDIRQLKVGQLIRHRSSGDLFVVVSNADRHFTAALVLPIDNPSDWTNA